MSHIWRRGQVRSGAFMRAPRSDQDVIRHPPGVDLAQEAWPMLCGRFCRQPKASPMQIRGIPAKRPHGHGAQAAQR